MHIIQTIVNLKNEIENLKQKQKLAKCRTKSLNEENEILEKELEISKFEFSEIEKKYNQGNVQNLFSFIG